MRRMSSVLVVLVACSDPEPPLSSATSLQCPDPGALPFRLPSSGFERTANKTIAADNPHFKDEASDVLGNPGGAVASVYLSDAQGPGPTVIYRGVKARTTVTGGLSARVLPGENVSLWTYDEAASEWHALARARTGDDGVYELTSDLAPAAGQPVYAMLDADQSCAAHYTALLPRGAKVVVTDIDGTLTTDDLELLKQIGDETYVPAMMTAASALMQAWAAKGYAIVYLTARPHLFRAESRSWLDALGFPAGAMITTNGEAADAGAYKTIWMKRMIQDFGWSVVAAYGNADTDIVAYENASVPKEVTFIIGPLAGTSGTMAISNKDYTAHISAFVAAQQPANP